MTHDTPIAVPTGSKRISQIKEGEEVLAASAQMANGKVELAWEASKVSFNSGSGESSHHPRMLYVGLGGEHRLICSMDQPVLLANGKYTIARKLRPGQSLVDENGNGISIEHIAAGAYFGTVHDIETIAPWKNNPDGHLLLAGGVVVGDFKLQMFFTQLPDSMKETIEDEANVL